MVRLIQQHLGCVLVMIVCGLRCLGAGDSPAADENAALQLKPVRFSLAGGIYSTNPVVTLHTAEPNGTIRYTTDGSAPDPSSPLYERPVPITNSVVLKAAVFSPTDKSVTRSEAYALADPSVAEFNSNLPLVVINTFGNPIEKDTRTEAAIHIMDTNHGRALLAAPAGLSSQALIKLRGHSSLRYPKRSYAVKLRNAEGGPEKLPVLGMPKESDWVLYAPYPDKTLMRDVLAYEISNEVGQYAPRTRLVEVFVNPTGGRLTMRQYMGVFVLEEKIKRSKERVPITKLQPEENAEPEISGGYIIKKDHLDRVDPGAANIGGFPNGGGPSTSNRDGYPTGPGGFPADPKGFQSSRGRAEEQDAPGRDRLLRNGEGFISGHGSTFLYVEPDARDLTSEQRRWLLHYVHALEAALYGPDFRDPVRGYSAFIDVDSFIDYHLLVEATKNIDGFRFSTFYSKDRGGKLHMGPIWDWNLSLGAANGKEGYMPETWYWPQLDDQQYSWFRRLFQDPDFAQRYVDRWAALRTNQLSTTRILARVDELAALLNEAQVRNFRRWKILGRQVWPQYYNGKSYAEEIQYMKTWINQHLSWMDRQFVAPPRFALDASANRKLTLHTSAGKVYFTTDASDPRAPGGAISERAQLYKSPIAWAPGTAVNARVLNGKRWSCSKQFERDR